MSLLVVGTVAFDALETPFGKTDKITGGSANYFCWSATNFVKDIKLVSVVGDDYDFEEIKQLNNRGVDTSGLQVKEGQKSFFWSGKYHMDMNTRDSLVTELNVLAEFDPVLPASYRDCEFVMLGNIAPALQIKVIKQMEQRPKLIAMDTMNFWMEKKMPELLEALKMVDVLIINDEEARQLSGQYGIVKAAKAILDMGPQFLVIKKGEHGALLFHGSEVFFAPALPLEEVFDPTGAGDTFAGGFIGYLASTRDTSFDNMKRAIIYGSALASFCVEKFGNQRMKELTSEELHERVQEFIDLVQFDISLVD
ncbi:MAG: PfkB family carbohydrate kinase [Chitinophagales bacterium]|nr:PfkB family carbohydrate kinase [Chitinophagales bacterium]